MQIGVRNNVESQPERVPATGDDQNKHNIEVYHYTNQLLDLIQTTVFKLGDLI